jgi:hypothetical protein
VANNMKFEGRIGEKKRAFKMEIVAGASGFLV